VHLLLLLLLLLLMMMMMLLLLLMLMLHLGLLLLQLLLPLQPLLQDRFAPRLQRLLQYLLCGCHLPGDSIHRHDL